MDSSLYFYECEIHIRKSVEKHGEQSNEKIIASGLQFIYFLACTLFELCRIS